MRHFLSLLYGERPAGWQTWEKRERNAEIYRRYLAGKDSVTLARVFGLSDRWVRTGAQTGRKLTSWDIENPMQSDRGFDGVRSPAGRRLWVPREGHYHLVIGQLLPQKAA